MDMYQKRKQRKEKREQTTGPDETLKSVSINWDVHIYVPIAFSPVFTRVYAK